MCTLPLLGYAAVILPNIQTRDDHGLGLSGATYSLY